MPDRPNSKLLKSVPCSVDFDLFPYHLTRNIRSGDSVCYVVGDHFTAFLHLVKRLFQHRLERFISALYQDRHHLMSVVEGYLSVTLHAAVGVTIQRCDPLSSTCFILSVFVTVKTFGTRGIAGRSNYWASRQLRLNRLRCLASLWCPFYRLFWVCQQLILIIVHPCFGEGF